MLWSIRRYQPERSLESRQELTDWVTHVLIKLRGLAEQSVGRFGRRLVCWPNNNFPPENNKIKSDIMTKLLKAKSEEELTATARKCALVGGGALDLRVQYREAWEALLRFDSDTWDLVVQVTNVVKHQRKLQVEDTASGLALVHMEVQHPLLSLLQTFLGQVKGLVETFNRTRAETEELLSAAKAGNKSGFIDLAPFRKRMPLDRADTAGNTPLHWVCRRDDYVQLEVLAQDPVTLRRACRPNRRGETPLTLGNGICAERLQFHLTMMS